MKLLLREKSILGFYFIIGLAERKINKNSACYSVYCTFYKEL